MDGERIICNQYEVEEKLRYDLIMVFLACLEHCEEHKERESNIFNGSYVQFYVSVFSEKKKLTYNDAI